jgi:hypothetical protein
MPTLKHFNHDFIANIIPDLNYRKIRYLNVNEHKMLKKL